MPTWFQYFGYGTALVAVLMFAGALRKFITAPARLGYRYYDAVTMIAALYPAGLSFKLLMFGPDFLRFHLTDIGFPVAVGWVITLHAMHRLKDIPLERLDDRYRERIADTTMYIRAIAIGCGLSYAYETFTGIVYWVARDRVARLQDPLVGNFDPVDIAMYTLGAGAAILLLMRERKYVQYELLPVATEIQQKRDTTQKAGERQLRRQQPNKRPGKTGQRRRRRR